MQYKRVAVTIDCECVAYYQCHVVSSLFIVRRVCREILSSKYDIRLFAHAQCIEYHVVRHGNATMSININF